MKIAVVTCYQHNDYVRARTLRAAVSACPDSQALVIRNRHRGVLRYPEVVLRLCKTRIFDKPDAYVITFRGYEMLLAMRLTFVRKPIIFDELVNFTEWMEEHGRLRAGSVPYRLFRWWYGRLARYCRFILADTDAHGELSAKLNKLSIDRYRTIPVSTDETVFFPQAAGKTENFTVVYYGNMLALHGLGYVLDAARLLKHAPNIQFRLIGGKKQVAEACAKAAADGANVIHENWVPFEDLPAIVRSAGLALGGPFGDTAQSQYVVTGKTFQSLACAAPVLVGRNEVHEGFADKQNCLVVPQADPAAIASAISWAEAHREELARIGQAGRKLYDDHFSQAVINRRVQKILEEL